MVDVDSLLIAMGQAADAVASVLDDASDWRLGDPERGQYLVDLDADAVAVAPLLDAGLGVLSEESGRHAPERELTVVIDPLDGSTNAARGIPWYATSLCAVDGDGPLAALVVDQAHGTRFEAIRGGGATRDSDSIAPAPEVPLGGAIVGLADLPAAHLGWDQYRCFGAAALDLCAVASGVLDGYVDCGIDAHGSWDYLGGLLVCREAGAMVADGDGRDLVVLDHEARRSPVAASSQGLLDELVTARMGSIHRST